MKLTYIAQGGEPVGDGGDQYTGLDRFGRVVDQRWMNSGGSALDRIQYGFDRASNRLYRANVVAEAVSANQDEYYTYDTLNQLLTLQRGTLNSSRTGIAGTPAAEEDFTFDPTGNWDEYQTKASGSTTLDQSRTHNAANEIAGIDGSSAYIGQDAAGNVTKAPKPTSWGAANILVYDAWNRLVKVKDGSSTVATYAYDGQNRRVNKATGSMRHYYYTQAWQIIEERLNTATTADRQNVWGQVGLDNLILRDRGAERFYLTSDVFNATAIVNISGSVQERYGYAAFGQPRFMDGSFGSRSSSSSDWETLYGDYRFDPESGYYQVRFRYLHPTLGRWLSRDPVGYIDGANFYIYVINNPVNIIDLYGLATANEYTFGEIENWAIVSYQDLKTIPAGLGDAKASINSVCTKTKCHQSCNPIDGSKLTNPNRHAAWEHIVAASGSDNSSGANYFCVGTTKCSFVSKCCKCVNPKEKDPNKKKYCCVNRSKALTPVSTVTVSGMQGGTLYFYKDTNCQNCGSEDQKNECITTPKLKGCGGC